MPFEEAEYKRQPKAIQICSRHRWQVILKAWNRYYTLASGHVWTLEARIVLAEMTSNASWCCLHFTCFQLAVRNTRFVYQMTYDTRSSVNIWRHFLQWIIKYMVSFGVKWNEDPILHCPNVTCGWSTPPCNLEYEWIITYHYLWGWNYMPKSRCRLRSFFTKRPSVN